MPAAGRLLISQITLRGPEIESLYHCIAAQPGISYADLATQLVPLTGERDSADMHEAILREALHFLRGARLIEQQGGRMPQAQFHSTPRLAELCFPLLLVHHITQHQDVRQQALALIHRQLCRDDCLHTTLSAVRDQMERGPYQDLFVWTGEKIGCWGHLAQHLGLIRRLPPRADILVLPHLEIVHTALVWASRQCQTTALMPLLQLIDTTFFACFTARGHIHQGLAQALQALERQGTLQLVHHSDAAQSILVGTRRVSTVASAVFTRVP